MFDRSQVDTLDEIVPVHNIRVTLRMAEASGARLVPAGLELEITRTANGNQQVVAPIVHEHEMVVFDVQACAD